MSTDNRAGKFDIAVFSAVPYGHLLRGRTGAFVDTLSRKGFFIHYFEIPPASIFQYFKNPGSEHPSFLDFLFPKPRALDNKIIYSFSPIFPAARFNQGLISKYNKHNLIHTLQSRFIPLINKRNRPVIAFVVTPWWYEIIDKINFSLLCYDCIDDIRVFCNKKQFKYFSESQRKLIKQSDLIIISANKLKEDVISVRPDAKIEFLPNGVDINFFSSKSSNSSTPLPLRNIRRPIIGFVGTLYSWIDLKIIEATAKVFTNASIVLVGPVENIKIPQLPNIIQLPAIPYASVPEYINNFDVCIIPFIADALSEKVDPIKVYEYLSLGKPVVAINLSELEKAKDLIYLAKDNNDFINCIKRALAENDTLIRKRRIEYAIQNSWSIRVEQLVRVFDKYLDKKQNTQLSNRN